jgi:uncharacterized membrane protein YjjB (DUF3815 family)
MCAISTIGFVVSSLCSTAAAAADFSTVVSALAVGVCANAWARYRREPAIVLVISGILLLVPGGISVKSVAALLNQNSDSSLSSGFAAQMCIIALSITVGVSLANLFVFPKEELSYQHL